jgi:superfamily I DNA and/or RNA helicase
MSLRSLGWVFIDEAGQAAPHQAVGVFSRAKRVIVLGDPMQLPPIVTIPKELTELILNKYQVSPKLFSVNQYSVQTMSDRNAEIGTWVRQGYEKIWTGLPLRVHRRCRDPMFKISNEIAYDRQMVQARSQKAPPNRLGESFWLDVVGKKLLKWDSHAFQEEIDALLMLIQQSDRDLKTYVITPFKSISFALRNKLPKSIDCGTIHSFQGKEADVVFLILGGNTKMSGAIGWAANQRNLLNTAVTRAKHYLYIIGNYDVWQNQGFFEEISKAFPRKQLHQNEDPLASEQEVPIVNIEC